MGCIRCLCALWLLLIISSINAKEEACIGVVLGGADSFFQHVLQGATDAGEALGVKVSLRGPSGFDKLTAQISIIETLRKRGCDAFVIAPISSDIDNIVNSLWEQGIPSVYIDRDTDGNHDAVSIIATDNYQAGRKAGEQMIKALSGKGKVALLRLKKGITSTDKREKGFYDVVTDAGLDVVVDEYIGVEVGEAYQNGKQLADRLSGVAGVFTPNETTTEGMLRVWNKIALAQLPVHIGFDLSPIIAQGIEMKQVHGVVIQDPHGMGYQGVVAAVNARLGKSIPKRAATTTHFVTVDSLDKHIVSP